MKYTVEIEFKKERHCVRCPLMDFESDNCKLQIDTENDVFLDFGTFEEQMKNCPLSEVEA